MPRRYRARFEFVKPVYLAPVRLPLLLLLIASPALAQGLPFYAPINPVAASRSGLSFEPFRPARPGRWDVSIGLGYASTIESNPLPAAAYLLDSELLRVRFGVAHDLTSRAFVLADAAVLGAYPGFLDGFLDWYHGLLGIEVPERDRRPRDSFSYALHLPGGPPIERRPDDLFLGDLRLGLGLRIHPAVQSVAAFTLPTATGPAGYGRGVVSVNLLNTVHLPLTGRVVYEGSLSTGYTPSHGALAQAQRELLVAASSGLRVRLFGRQSIYGNVFYHSPYYEGTTLPSLDRRELSFDFGWIIGTAAGSEWMIGMTEDVEPGGPAVDLVFRVGGRM